MIGVVYYKFITFIVQKHRIVCAYALVTETENNVPMSDHRNYTHAQSISVKSMAKDNHVIK